MNTLLEKIGFAFRNVMRNRKRTVLTALSIFFAAFISLLSVGWTSGILSSFMSNLVQYQTGDVRITTEGYIAREKFMPVDETMPGVEALKRTILAVPGVSDVEERIQFGIILAKDENSQGALAIAIEPGKTRMNVFDVLVDPDGKPLPNQKASGAGIRIGFRLAKKLGIRQGEELLVAGKTSEGGLNGIKVKVDSLFRSGIASYDDKAFVLTMSEAKRLLKLGDSAVSLYAFAKPGIKREVLAKSIAAVIPKDLAALTPREQIGTYWDTLEKSSQVFGLFLVVILFLASFVVINTMVMAVFERMREIGTLKAIGMTDRGIYWNFTIEGGILGLIGGLPGVLFAALFLLLTSNTGINMETAIRGINYPYQSIFKPVLNMSDVLFVLIASAVVPAIASTFPARMAKKLSPAEALRKI
jgi:putative ABC transport system permease protein